MPQIAIFTSKHIAKSEIVARDFTLLCGCVVLCVCDNTTYVQSTLFFLDGLEPHQYRCGNSQGAHFTQGKKDRRAVRQTGTVGGNNT